MLQQVFPVSFIDSKIIAKKKEKNKPKEGHMQPKKLRVGCLHGDRQDASVFQGQLGKIVQTCSDIADFVFVDAPFMRCDQNVEVQMRTWTDPSLSASTPFGVAAWHVFDHVGDDVDILLGFSQGCCVIQELLASVPCSTAIGDRATALKGLIFAGSPLPPAGSLTGPASVDLLQAMRSLHIVGRRDAVVPPCDSLEFAALFGHPVVVEHDHAHSIPQLQSVIGPVRLFLESLVENEGAAAAAAQMVAEELEIISNVFGEDVVQRRPGPKPRPSSRNARASSAATTVVSLDLMLDDMLPQDRPSAGGVAPRMIFSLLSSYPFSIPNVDLAGLPNALALGPFRADTLLALDQLCVGFIGSPMLMNMFMFVRDAAVRRLEEAAQSPTHRDKFGRSGEDGGDGAPDASWWRVEDESEAELVEKIHMAREQVAAWVAAAQKGGGIQPVPGLGGSRVTVGLVGKPSAGKSTFFNAVTRALDSDAKRAKVGAFPFTTIEPNIGFGYIPIPCPCVSLSTTGPADSDDTSAAATTTLQLCDCSSGHVEIGGTVYRRHPAIIKDVAGLVQGAYKGHGKGNQFLNDLCDADVLIHVVDGAATTDASGGAVPAGEGSAVEDITWVKDELHCWIYDNVRAKWDVIARKPAKLLGMFSGYHARHAVVNESLLRCGISSPKELSLRVPTWSDKDLHLLVAHFLHLRFPVVTALNKCDVDGAAKVVRRVRTAFPNELFAEMSAKLECDRLSKFSSNTPTAEGGCEDPLVLHCGPFTATQRHQPRLSLFNSGVNDALLLAASTVCLTLVFPSSGLAQALRDRHLPSLSRCLTVSSCSTVEDIFASMMSAGCFPDARVKLVRFEYFVAEDYSTSKGQGSNAAEITSSSWRVLVARKDETIPGRLLVIHAMTNRMAGN